MRRLKIVETSWRLKREHNLAKAEVLKHKPESQGFKNTRLVSVV